MNTRLFMKSLFAAGIFCCAVGGAKADPVWDRINSSGKIVCGAVPNDSPGSWQERGSDRWQGYEIDLCRAIADDLSKDMGKLITPEFRETSWKTIVLDVQSNKIDLWPGMSATPEREKALSMIGPMYGLAFCAVISKAFTGGQTWESLNNPSVRIATVTGTSIETAFKQAAPKATHITLSGFDEIALAVQSGRADVMGADALRCLNVHKTAAAAFGPITFPTPVKSLGSSAGVQKSAERLTTWLKAWSEKKQAAGEIKTIFVNVFKQAGFDTSIIPPEVQF